MPDAPELPVVVSPQVCTLAETLWQANYHTVGIGRWGLAGTDGPGLPNRQGFDRWFGYLRDVQTPPLYPTILYRNESEVQVKANLDDKRGAYANDLFTQEALNFLDGNTPDPQKPQQRIRDFPTPPPFFLYIAYPAFTDLPPRDLHGNEVKTDAPYSSEDWTAEQRELAAGISRLDNHVGAILDKLEERGLSKNTIVIFTSANGPTGAPAEQVAFFNRLGSFRDGAAGLNEGGIHVPLIIRQGLSTRAGSVSDQLGANWDLHPTAAELVGAFRIAKPLDGVSLFRAISRQPTFDRNTLYWERRAGDQSLWQAARAGKWKGLKTTPAQPDHYDLLTDPAESKSQQPEPAAVAEEIRKTLEAAAD